MIFRIVNGKLLEVRTIIKDEDEFVQQHNSTELSFIKVDSQDIPTEYYDGAKLLYDEETQSIKVDTEQYLQLLKERKIDLLNRVFQYESRSFIKQYPDMEIYTWTEQAKEAKAYIEDHTAYTPMIDNIVHVRGISKDALVQKILEKANVYTAYLGQLIGKRQKIEGMIELANSVEEIQNIDIESLFRE